MYKKHRTKEEQLKLHNSRNVAQRLVEQMPAKRNGLSWRSSNGQFWFKDQTAYSYRTPIARWLPNHHVMLVTSHVYSSTTDGKHKNQLYYAARRANAKIFNVPDFKEGCDHDANLAYLIGKYRDYVERLRNWPVHLDAGEWRRKHMMQLWLQASEYKDVFRIAGRLPDFERDVNRIDNKQARKRLKYNSPKAVEAREFRKAKDNLKMLVFGTTKVPV